MQLRNWLDLQAELRDASSPTCSSTDQETEDWEGWILFWNSLSSSPLSETQMAAKHGWKMIPDLYYRTFCD